MHNPVRVRFKHLVLALLLVAAAAFFAAPAYAQAPPAVIGEFRYRGPSGPFDEFVEIFNNSDVPVTVAGDGWALVTGDDPTTPKFVIPAGTVIPARGRFLITNAIGYSLFVYPAGNGTTATGDGSYLTDIPDNVGFALFSTADPAGFTLANRLDAVGTTAEPNALFREGAGLPPVLPNDIEYTFARHVPTPCPNSPNNCTTGGAPPFYTPQDTNDNAADFFYMDPEGSDIGAGQRLGAPSPQNLSSPRLTGAVPNTLVDTTVSNASQPNRVRNATPTPLDPFGTLLVRRRFTNVSSSPVTRIRFQVVDITTFPAATGTAILVVRPSTGSFFTTNDPAACAPSPAPCTAFAHGLTIDEPPLQPNGGGYHTTLSTGAVTLAQPLQPGQSINFEFLLGVQQTGLARFFFLAESLF